MYGMVNAGESRVAVHVYGPLCDKRMKSYVMVCVTTVLSITSAPTVMPSPLDTGFLSGPVHSIIGVLEIPLPLSTATQLMENVDPAAGALVLRSSIWTIIGSETGTMEKESQAIRLLQVPLNILFNATYSQKDKIGNKSSAWSVSKL